MHAVIGIVAVSLCKIVRIGRVLPQPAYRSRNAGANAPKSEIAGLYACPYKSLRRCPRDNIDGASECILAINPGGRALQYLNPFDGIEVNW